ncbi:serine hydrolase domain-containing protein [Halioxenophilus sp. WMMB6]|uniref:serine hydrolase domain-containing protein n=1 Tax=Halioxenophilus sp. WMMB6 TaxID=3073815 RepID=UPI00295F106C|nr:serine hydrolase domain-containing protein [Halioxenophilus sp. WMMB6]
MKRLSLVSLAAALLLASCGGSSGSGSQASIEAELEQILSSIATDSDFTLLVQANDGTQYSYSRGNSTAETSYRSASTSKMVTATIILRLVEDGILSLSDHPQAYLDFWPTSGNLSQITLRDLLSFTSGLTEEPLCINNPLADFANCVAQLASSNSGSPPPGSQFYYASTHLQVAGLMAVQAAGLADWQAVFDYFTSATGLFANASYDLPSASNPRLAGGMHWQASEYLDFLAALYRGEILSPTLFTAMTSDQIGDATIAFSPVDEGDIDQDWHYGFGNWIECANTPFNCDTTTRVSSAGAYGAYPFIDFEHHYVGIVAREGSLGTGTRGYQVWQSVAGELGQWADTHQ